MAIKRQQQAADDGVPLSCTMLECNCIETNTRVGGLTKRTILGLLFSRVNAYKRGVKSRKISRIPQANYNGAHEKIWVRGDRIDNTVDNGDDPLRNVKKIDTAITIVRQWVVADRGISPTDPWTAITSYCNMTIARSLLLMHFTGVHSIVHVVDWQRTRGACFIISWHAPVTSIRQAPQSIERSSN